MKKCNKCNILTKILYYDVIVEKCNECNTIILLYNDINDLIINIMRHYNVGDYKKYTNQLQISNIDRKIIETFKKNFIIGEQFIPDNLYQCNVCDQDLIKINFNENFIFYFCKYCGRVYINKNDLENYIQKCLKQLKKYYFLKKINRFLHLN